MVVGKLHVGLASIVSIVAFAAWAPTHASSSGATVLVVSPSSIRAGFQIEVRATCQDNLNPATVTSAVFGRLTLVPENGVLMTTVTIPSDTAAGTYTVSLACASGGRSSAQLTVLDGSHPSGNTPNMHHGPETGGGEMSSTTAGRLALVGGLGALITGIGLCLVTARRRRTTV